MFKLEYLLLFSMPTSTQTCSCGPNIPLLAQAAALINEGFLDRLAPVDLLEEYWSTTLKDHCGHPLAGQPEKWKRCIPICLWGDEGTVGKTSWMISSWIPGFTSLCCWCLLSSFQGTLVGHTVLGGMLSAAFYLRMADLSSCRQDSRSSRCAMFSMPVERYFMEGKVNATLQSLYARLVQDLNNMANDGVSTNHGVPFVASSSPWFVRCEVFPTKIYNLNMYCSEKTTENSVTTELTYWIMYPELTYWIMYP